VSDLETFHVDESANMGTSAESFRQYQERVKEAASQIKEIKAGERKQKKKEDEFLAGKISGEEYSKVRKDYLEFRENR